MFFPSAGILKFNKNCNLFELKLLLENMMSYETAFSYKILLIIAIASRVRSSAGMENEVPSGGGSAGMENEVPSGGGSAGMENEVPSSSSAIQMSDAVRGTYF
jgi:hypothetical protein